MKRTLELQTRARERFGFFGSLIVHFIVFILLSLSGVLYNQHNNASLTEITFFDAGGGGGGGGGGQEVPAQEDTVVEEAAEAASAAGEEDIGYTDAKPEAVKPKQVEIKRAPVKMAGVPTKPGGSGSGYGGGHGTGYGTGTGSGVGPGSGSGSGGGHGSGHGTGIGSGVGAGISRNPAVPPRVVYSVSPVYPESQRQANIDGVSLLRLLIGTNGRVEEVTLLKSSGSSALDNSAIRACRQWRFSSAKNGSGQKVRCYWDIPIRFRLDR